MWSVAYFALVFLILLGRSKGLKCWHCENENSNWECLQNGKLVECLPNQEECQNEMRFISNNRYFKISKGCKQGVGCFNHRNQNQLHTNAYQCEKRDVEDVCWCCCDGDNCNGQYVYCQKLQPNCDPLTAPLNGIVTCNRGDGKLGTNCLYRCLPGFQIDGVAATTCVRTKYAAIWSSSQPSCEELTCASLPEAPEHGSVSCSNGILLYSICDFSCDANYHLIGAISTTCSHLGIWSNPSPVCVPIVCRWPKRMDQNLRTDCSNGNKLGSICSFRCVRSFALSGSSQLECGEPIFRRFGRWDGKIPKCVRTGCPRLRDSRSRECTNGNDIGSVCTYTCDEGQYIQAGLTIVQENTYSIICEEDGWSNTEAICRDILCPSAQRIQNGVVKCSNGFKLGSICRYTCNDGYRRIGNEAIQCGASDEKATGRWSGSPPRCVGSETGAGWCRNYPVVPSGEVTCSPPRFGNGTHWLPGTECELFCSGGFIAPIGSLSKIRCTSSGWNGELCCDRCLSSPRLDIVVLMDSSYADEDLWEVSKTFSSDFALHITEEYGFQLNFIIIPYATTVDSNSIVKARNITFDNYEVLNGLTEFIPVTKSGESNLGQALEYVRNQILDELRDGSVPLIVILSNRVPTDYDLALEQTQALRDRRIQIRIVPLLDFFTASAGSNKSSFESLTGGATNSVVESNSVETFFEDAAAGIGDYYTYCDTSVTTC